MADPPEVKTTWYSFTAAEWNGFTENRWDWFVPFASFGFIIGYMSELFIDMIETIRGPHIKG